MNDKEDCRALASTFGPEAVSSYGEKLKGLLEPDIDMKKELEQNVYLDGNLSSNVPLPTSKKIEDFIGEIHRWSVSNKNWHLTELNKCS